MRIFRNLAYGTGTRDRYNLYLPDGDWTQLLIYFHGGAWLGGDLNYEGSGDDMAAHWVPLGYGLVCSNYPLGKIFPANLNGVAEVCRHLASRHPSKQLFAGGHSAGGHLVALAQAKRLIPDISATFLLDPALYNPHTASGGYQLLLLYAFEYGQFDDISLEHQTDTDTYDQEARVWISADPFAQNHKTDFTNWAATMDGGSLTDISPGDHDQVFYDFYTPGSTVETEARALFEAHKVVTPPAPGLPAAAWSVVPGNDGEQWLSEPAGDREDAVTPIDPVTSLTVAKATPDSLTLEWDYSRSDHAGFVVQRWLNGYWGADAALDAGVRSYRATDLSDGTEYGHRVQVLGPANSVWVEAWGWTEMDDPGTPEPPPVVPPPSRPPPTDPNAEAVFTDDFASGNLGKWSTHPGPSGSIGVEGGAAKLVFGALAPGRYQNGPFMRANLRVHGLREVYLKFRFKTDGAGNAKFVKCFGGAQGASIYSNWTVSRQQAGQGYDRVYFGDGSGTANDSQVILRWDKTHTPSNTRGTGAGRYIYSAKQSIGNHLDWKTYEIYWRYNSGTSRANEKPDGVFMTWVDGRLLCHAVDFFNKHPETPPIEMISLGDVSQQGGFSVWYDDVEIWDGLPSTAGNG